MTAGIVSARGRDIGSGPTTTSSRSMRPINKGNSAARPSTSSDGADRGQHRDLSRRRTGSVGIGFDIPANTAKMVMEQLEEHGHVTRGWIGVRVQAVTPDIAGDPGMKTVAGVHIDEPAGRWPGRQGGYRGWRRHHRHGINGKDVKDFARSCPADRRRWRPAPSCTLAVLHNGAEKSRVAYARHFAHWSQANLAKPSSRAIRIPRPRASASPWRRPGSVDGAVAVTTSTPTAAQRHRSDDIILEVAGKTSIKPAGLRQQLLLHGTASRFRSCGGWGCCSASSSPFLLGRR